MEFKFNDQTGVIEDKVTGERCIIITQNRMKEIFSKLSEIFKSGAIVIISEACKAAGERYVQEAAKGKNVDKALFLKTVVQRFTDAGLGKIEIVEFNPEATEVKFRILNNFFAEIRNEESTYCNCIESFVRGIYERIMLKTPEIQETKCIGKGDPYREWQLTSK